MLNLQINKKKLQPLVPFATVIKAHAMFYF